MKKKLSLKKLQVQSFVTELPVEGANALRGGETLKNCNITHESPCPTYPCITRPVTGIWCISDTIGAAIDVP